MSTIAIRVDEELKDEASKLYKSMGLDMTTAIKLFLTQSVLTQSIPFTIKGNNDVIFETRIGETSALIRTRNISEYNLETQKSYYDTIERINREGVKPSTESVDDFFERMIRENADA
ncbi:type II toxin-antitoxin system RelB/DinJ family antitoxin [Streptococcus cuniculi]|uniref:Type II toxin-antitoxin system RelB/DinJ family antitoxin n=1 Tax=Streptococcus cuniculi TaxID=1432788 RepID=A0A4Y9JD87_9STRE|nr:type II toxin-antitoxin system RelB/DinJ family antitoxin [Streptococcus cuniculi]MBF0777850.1 type II toxin-antitoxin system RelB/DinJ family antitoxin [Streptococcus cuniculi]TFU98148.1 type II toxin-antitoxin system RelB/DinJ family antitoxin [Streptococcus cuniculi]